MPMNILIDYDSENGRILVTNKIRIKPNVVSTGMGLKNLSARYLLDMQSGYYHRKQYELFYR